MNLRTKGLCAMALAACTMLVVGMARTARADCGNGVQEGSEQCDNGTGVCGAAALNPGTPCTANSQCFGDVCKDTGCTGPGGKCNRSDLADHCRPTCKLPSCGDGVTDTPENCDDGNTNNNDFCKNTCKFNTCGDGVLNSAPGSPEQCDDGNTVSGDNCSATCQNEHCGDMITTLPEQCDLGQGKCNGGLRAGQICLKSIQCPPASACLNGVGGPPNLDDVPFTCRTNCQFAHCGDGVTDTLLGEQCDDGNTNDNDACKNNCKNNVCGDGVLNSAPGSPEQCDDGNTVSGDNCSATCQLEHCGDMITTLPEQCDLGQGKCNGGIRAGQICLKTTQCPPASACLNASAGTPNLDDAPNFACRTNCQFAHCGDGVTDTLLGEVCDDGNTVNTDACPNSCKNPVCGNGILEGSEQCDDGNTNNLDGCSNTCVLSRCGDSIVQAGEVCDNGQAVCVGGIRNGLDCSTDAECVGGLCQVGKNRDDVANACRSNCQPAHCGDGVTDAPENCDDGNSNNSDGCTNACKFPACGDGFTQASNGETCDDGNTVSGDGCSSTCKLEHCGDGTLNSGETCDDGTAVCQGGPRNGLACVKPADCAGNPCNCTGSPFTCVSGGNSDVTANACRSNCALAHCGDGVTDLGETCDDGNTVNTDSCPNSCQPAVCGNGVKEGTEQCDDGNAVPNDGCTSCVLDRCGDGTTQTAIGEQCDGNIPFCSSQASNPAPHDCCLDSFNGVYTELATTDQVFAALSCRYTRMGATAAACNASMVKRVLSSAKKVTQASQALAALNKQKAGAHARSAAKIIANLSSKAVRVCPGSATGVAQNVNDATGLLNNLQDLILNP